MKSIALGILIAIIGTCHCQAQVPEDGGRYTIIVVTQPQPSPTAGQLVRWLAEDPHFAELMAQVHYHQFTSDNALYQRRYAAQLPETPVIALVRPDGGVEYKASGSNIPATAAALHAEMLHYHNLHPYYPPRQPEAWPDTRVYAESSGYPLRDSRQIAPPYPSTGGPSAIAWMLLAAGGVLAVCIIAALAYLLFADD
ncbi:hypothetical protein [Rosistilla oblonga]|uniref:Uncharacterized protein n=1 Tax=Rosistilla oblonga TaxID=2527990 RepID=A0A518ITS9_9BACT|nr:hypothetical protein [Rosistilla oblonga]QDV56497.1 hypothetical protein Mal33_24880 [Rosistilla oblonga]